MYTRICIQNYFIILFVYYVIKWHPFSKDKIIKNHYSSVICINIYRIKIEFISNRALGTKKLYIDISLRLGCKNLCLNVMFVYIKIRFLKNILLPSLTASPEYKAKSFNESELYLTLKKRISFKLEIKILSIKVIKKWCWIQTNYNYMIDFLFF